MITIGAYNTLTVEREVDFGFYLDDGADGILLPSRYAPAGLKPGDDLSVFVYTDSEDRPIATTKTPAGVVGDFVVLTVKDTHRIGAFMDWGLEKDLLVPRNEQRKRMNPGEEHIIRICYDSVTDRVYGSARIQAFCIPVPKTVFEGQQVSLLIHDTTAIGIMAVVNNEFEGMLYKNETFETLRPGDRKQGYILKIRDDGKTDLSLKKPGFNSISESTEVILEQLKKTEGFLPYHDKSSPDEIKSYFAMSKKEFKRATGSLYKQGKIRILKNGIQLIVETESRDNNE